MKTILFLCAALLLPACGEDLSTEGGLKTARFGNFVFEYPKEEETTVRSLGKHCPVIEERIAEDLGPVSLGTVRVLIAADEQAFLDAWPGTGTPRRWAAAVANPEAGVIVMKSPKMLLGSRDTYETIFLHEVTHIALHRAISLPPDTGGGPGTPEPDALFPRGPRSPEIPTWLHEGYAQYLARQWSPSHEYLLTRAVLRRDLIPLGSLVRGFPEDRERSSLAYAQSADLVHFLIRRFGKESFHRFLYALGTEGSFGAASRHVFGEEFFALEEAWRRHLQKRYTWIPLLGSTGTLWFLATVLLLLAYLRKKVSSRRRLREWSQEDPF